jgi:hypothetical protein
MLVWRRSWEPDACRLRRLTAPQARQCLNRKKLVFIGDSITRYIYSTLVHFLSREVWPERYGGLKGGRSVVIGREFTVGKPGPDVWCGAAGCALFLLCRCHSLESSGTHMLSSALRNFVCGVRM